MNVNKQKYCHMSEGNACKISSVLALFL